MNKQRIIQILHEREYIKTLHNQIVNGLVGSMKHEYMGVFPREGRSMERIISPILRTMVDMFANNFIYYASEKLVDEILEVIEMEKRSGE